jgi:hypothetical protein
MSLGSIKWTIFVALSLTVPAMFFLVQVVMFIPAIFFVAGMAVVIPKIFSPGHTTEPLWFMIFLGVHALIYAAAYYMVSLLCAKAVLRIKSKLTRNVVLGIFFLGLLYVTHQPVYGAGGHGPMRWHTLIGMLADLNKSYGTGAAEIVYGSAILLLCMMILFQRYRANRH